MDLDAALLMPSFHDHRSSLCRCYPTGDLRRFAALHNFAPVKYCNQIFPRYDDGRLNRRGLHCGCSMFVKRENVIYIDGVRKYSLTRNRY